MTVGLTTSESIVEQWGWLIDSSDKVSGLICDCNMFIDLARGTVIVWVQPPFPLTVCACAVVDHPDYFPF